MLQCGWTEEVAGCFIDILCMCAWAAVSKQRRLCMLAHLPDLTAVVLLSFAFCPLAHGLQPAPRSLTSRLCSVYARYAALIARTRVSNSIVSKCINTDGKSHCPCVMFLLLLPCLCSVCVHTGFNLRQGPSPADFAQYTPDIAALMARSALVQCKSSSRLAELTSLNTAGPGRVCCA